MKVIHAYRRKEATTVELFGLSIEFKPNEKKDVVAEVVHEEAVIRLLSISEAYRQYIDRSHITASAIAPGAITTSRLQTPADDLAHEKGGIAAQDLVGHVDATHIAAGSISVAKIAPTLPAAAEQSVVSEQASGEGNSTSTNKDEGASDSPYVFANEAGETIDISEWTAAQIRAFAESNEISLPKGNSVKVGELRDLLADALRAGSKE